MIARHEDEFPVRLMCRVLAVSASDYHAYRRRAESWRAVIDDVLMAHVRIAFAESGEAYVQVHPNSRSVKRPGFSGE